VRNAIKEDIFQFAIPGITVFCVELVFCARDRLSGFWETVWGLVKQPETLSSFPVHILLGLALFFAGLAVMLVGQITLWRNYSGTVVIRENHELITHGVYRFTRNPIYLGGLLAVIALPIFAASLYGFLTSLVLIPIILNRIRLEERLLSEEFGDAYREYLATTKKLIPFVY
jgi:protein-S-isoprenylcysteine O-methyltransferase Ste14